ncbi:uncharacterized protein BKA78DRAFT_301151 [Phyllosticta capitalensis]|uniref:uncharacterized protein n=1 Tax=Phyllosticta capitalensis TaxID=121624 RepID=UPI00312E3034
MLLSFCLASFPPFLVQFIHYGDSCANSWASLLAGVSSMELCLGFVHGFLVCVRSMAAEGGMYDEPTTAGVTCCLLVAVFIGHECNSSFIHRHLFDFSRLPADPAAWTWRVPCVAQMKSHSGKAT